MEYQQDLWGTRSVRVLHRTAVFHFQARSGIRRQGNEEPVADPDHKRKGDQSTESQWRLLYAVRQLPDGKIGLYPAHGHGPLPALKKGGCVCDRVGALHCPAADLKRERDARKSAGPAPADAAAALPIRSIETYDTTMQERKRKHRFFFCSGVKERTVFMSIAVIRNMDTQGRIIIPADIRKETGIRSGSTLEIATDGTTIRIRKCTPRNTGSKELRDFLEPLYKNIRCGLAISSTDCILASKGCYLPEGAQITEELRSFIEESKEMFSQLGLCPPVPDCSRKVAALFPITLALASKKAALLLIPEPGRCLSGAECNCTRLIANMITRKYKPNE